MAGLLSAIVRACTRVCSHVQAARRRKLLGGSVARQNSRANEASRGRESNERERAGVSVVIKPQAKFPTVRSTRHASLRLHIPHSIAFPRRDPIHHKCNQIVLRAITIRSIPFQSPSPSHATLFLC